MAKSFTVRKGEYQRPALSFKDDLGPLVLIIAEVLIAGWCLLKRKAVADEECRIDLTFLDHAQELPAVFLDVCLAALDRETFLHHRA